MLNSFFAVFYSIHPASSIYTNYATNYGPNGESAFSTTFIENRRTSDTLIGYLPIFSDASQNFPMHKISLESHEFHIFLKIRKEVAKFVVCCSRDWRFKG